MRPTRCYVVAVVAALGLGASPVPAAGAALRAGAAASDITPPIGTPMFAYTARSGIPLAGSTTEQVALQLVADPPPGLYAKTFIASTGIHTRVRARAIVLETERGKLALVQADLGGLPYALVQEVLRRIEGTGIAEDRLVLSATHTHSSTGPIWPTADNGGYALLGGDAFDARVFDVTAEGIAEAIRAANGRLEPARLGVGTSEVGNASSNRGFEAYQRNPESPKDEALARQTAIDPQVTAIRVDAADGRPLGVWSNFAVHPTTFGDENLLFSGDNPAFAERISEALVERRAERDGHAPRRPVVNVWTNSNEGDISPHGEPDDPERDPQAKGPSKTALQYRPNDFAEAHLTGARVARGIFRAWRAAGADMTGAPALDVRRTFLAFDGSSANGEPVGPLAVLGGGGITFPDGFCAPVDNLAGPGQGRKYPLLIGAGLVPNVVPVSVVRVGELGIAALPAEITRQMGARIRGAVQREGGGVFERVILGGLTNAYISYTSTPEEYDACHYEGSFTLFGRRQGPLYVELARALTAALARGEPAPAGAPEPPPFGFASQAGPSPRETPEAGTALRQPPTSARRLGLVRFRWRGGDPAVDVARSRAFVTVERETKGGWREFATDDSFLDTTERSAGDVWTETFQFTECDPLGRYRFAVSGRADKGSGVEPYRVVSRPVDLGETPIEFGRAVVTGRSARLVATYPDPGKDILLALPRRVRSGVALFKVRPRRGRVRFVRARLDARRLAFVARVPRRSRVRVLGVRDRCGNQVGNVSRRRKARSRRRAERRRRPSFTG